MFIKQITGIAQFHPDKMGKSTLFHCEHLLAGLNCFEPGQQHALHTHAGQDKLYVILEGKGEVQVGKETEVLSAGGWCQKAWLVGTSDERGNRTYNPVTNLRVGSSLLDDN